ncbi:NnrS family protein [Nitrospirillum sp. BR 11163]|uniref:NnrS family protein n=1 Tax=Nitrospirillum sp. BR 11163 TaxID=3104323 RepID=UPI002AFFD46C|nr:NnrS family protein [Nitrospirillum sp. BR 11163]MEA1673435.1 NnrS family protein [Nitrospirillum sp. BR 11163]
MRQHNDEGPGDLHPGQDPPGSALQSGGFPHGHRAPPLCRPHVLDPLAWHIHEMLFGFVMAGVAGFILQLDRPACHCRCWPCRPCCGSPPSPCSPPTTCRTGGGRDWPTDHHRGTSLPAQPPPDFAGNGFQHHIFQDSAPQRLYILNYPEESDGYACVVCKI